MSVEPGQLRVWGNSASVDKTPFLVLGLVDTGWFDKDWQILWRGDLSVWSNRRIETLSEVIDEAR